MDKDAKKISFGFSKLSKKPSPFFKKPTPVEEKKVQLIDCVEGQSIKIKDAVEEVYQPLIIPIKDNQKNLLDRVKDAKAKQKESLKKTEQLNEKPDSELTIEELAARELIKEAKQRLEQTTNGGESKIFVLPSVEDKLVIDGEIEPTLEDYENIPIQDFGLAMLRGMGWKDGMGIGKNPAKNSLLSAPELRPKGLGLGASKMVKTDKPKQSVDKNGKELLLVKGAFAKIIAGTNKGSYCEVQGLDEEGSRVIVKTSLKNEIINVNEFLLVAVTKEEYAKGSKVINNAKYEEYKEIMDKKLEKQKEELNKSSSSSSKYKRDEESDDEYYKQKHKEKSRSSKYKDNSSDSEYSKKKHSSRKHDSSDSDSEDYRRKEKERKSRSSDKKHKKSKHKKKSRSSSTDSSDYDRKSRRKHKSKSKHRHNSDSDSDRGYKRDRKHKR